MRIYLGGCVIEQSDAEFLAEDSTPNIVYCVDERDKIFCSVSDAQEYGETLAPVWNGDMYVSEYAVNIYWDDEKMEYALHDEDDAPLAFTGRYWTLTPDGWKEWKEEQA